MLPLVVVLVPVVLVVLVVLVLVLVPVLVVKVVFASAMIAAVVIGLVRAPARWRKGSHQPAIQLRLWTTTTTAVSKLITLLIVATQTVGLHPVTLQRLQATTMT